MFAFFKRILHRYRFWREPRVYGHAVQIPWTKEQFVAFARKNGELADWLRTCGQHEYTAYMTCCWVFFLSEQDAVECKLKFG